MVIINLNLTIDVDVPIDTVEQLEELLIYGDIEITHRNYNIVVERYLNRGCINLSHPDYGVCGQYMGKFVVAKQEENEHGTRKMPILWG